MVRAHQLLAERDGGAFGVVSVGAIEGAPQSVDLRDLWVAPEVRNTGIASRLVQAAADQRSRTAVRSCLLGQHGNRAGDRVFEQRRLPGDVWRRTTRVENREFGDQEIAFVLSLANDPAAVPTPAPSRRTSKPWPR